jgi:beta-glucosidase
VLFRSLDQESPQDRPWFDKLKADVEAGEIPVERVNDAAARIVRAMLDAGAIQNPAKAGGAIDKDAHAAISERVALSGMVLLKNDGVLPLAAKAKTIALIGGFADKGVLSGGGSSQVMPYGGHFADRRGREGISALLAPVYGLSSPMEALKALRPDAAITYDDGSDPVRAAALAKSVDVAIVFAPRAEEEGMDALAMALAPEQDALIAAVAAANPRTAVVLETGNPVTMPWLSKVGAVLQAWYPGQRGGQAIAKVLTGEVAPSGRLPMTFPADIAQLPRPAIPGFDPANRKPLGVGVKVEPFEVAFTEGADVGYRWFERKKARPLFAFGHGLTYTTFGYSGLKPRGGESLSATFTLANTGARDGVEVAQLYVAPPGQPHRLVGWARVALKPGEKREVTITADPRLLLSWDEKVGGWRREAGQFDLYVGKAAGSKDLAGKVALTAAIESARR